MSVDFIKGKHNTLSLAAAQRQQKQLSYFTQSCIQEEITQEYLEQWANRKYAGTDYFLTWIKMIFRTDNFLSFFKYLRHPLPSARLVNDNIKLQLKRVFTSEDGYSRYVISNKEVPAPDFLQSNKFAEDLFNALLFQHNDILFTDMKDVNEPVRYFVNIDQVVAIDSKDSVIHRIAFSAKAKVNGEEVIGYLYADDQRYVFYNREYAPLLDIPHDLEECPADYITLEYFHHNETWKYYNSDVIRKGIFTYVREDLEEYVFLKTLLKMTQPNGAIPIAVKLKTNEIDVSGQDKKGVSDKEPMSSFEIGGQRARVGSEVTGSRSILQAGTVVEIPGDQIRDAEDKINMEAITKYVNFFYTPVEALEYINKRIAEIRADIISAVLGDYSEADEGAKNELQVSKSYVSKEDKLRDLSNTLSVITTKSDTKMLAMKYGPGKVQVSRFFGTDFFLETQDSLYGKLKMSPNPIESKNLLQRLSRNRNMHNRVKAERERILYELLPFANSTDFSTALSQKIVTDEDIALQTRFPYWIGKFEAQYGDILSFWEMSGESDSVKIVLINNLLKQIINESESIRTPEVVQGQGNVV